MWAPDSRHELQALADVPGHFTPLRTVLRDCFRPGRPCTCRYSLVIASEPCPIPGLLSRRAVRFASGVGRGSQSELVCLQAVWDVLCSSHSISQHGQLASGTLNGV